MAERYATIVKRDDGREEISNISLFEGKPSEPPGDTKLIKIGDGPKIGMVKGGKGEAADGWGFDIPATDAAPAEDAPKKKASAKITKKAETKKDDGADTSSASDTSISGADQGQTAGSSQE